MGIFKTKKRERRLIKSAGATRRLSEKCAKRAKFSDLPFMNGALKSVASGEMF
jgi:hypothetical protein